MCLSYHLRSDIVIDERHTRASYPVLSALAPQPFRGAVSCDITPSMNSQGSSFSPQAVLERLTGEHNPEESGQISPADIRHAKSNLHALVIGINQYLHHSQLQGAVNDAKLFKSYLLDDLLVPEAQITTLLDTQATRAEIIKAFQNLATDPNIKHGDPIVIFYAGHGAEVEPPPSRQDANGSLVQSLVPQDAGSRSGSSSVIPPIPDFTIGSLLNRIANSKGDNITVIFDSCHSASVTRIDPGRGSRSIPYLFFDPLPEDIDSDVLAGDSVTSTRSLGTLQEGAEIRGMQSHVLLAACSSKGLAYEDLDTDPRHGFFTTALLKILRSVGPARLTYKSCIQRLPKLAAPRPQHPVCEGINVDRIFFDAKASGGDKSLVMLEEKEGRIYLQAGTAHGITPGCVFAIHNHVVLDPSNQPLGTMIVDQVTPFRSLLKFSDDTPVFIIPKPAYGRQISAGNEDALDIYFTPEFEKAIKPDPRWKTAFSGGQNEVVLRLAERDLAELIVDVDAHGYATFTFTRLKPAIKNGMATLGHTATAKYPSVYRFISWAARFIWHLERFPATRPFQAKVKMEFYKLRETGEKEETGSPILDIDSLDLNYNGSASVVFDSKDRYGFRITNTTSRDLYAYLFDFSLNTLEIGSKFLPVVGNGRVDPSLPKGGTLTLGYGSGGVKPFEFHLGPNEPIGVEIFKLFISTSPIDLSSVEQEPVYFQTRAFLSEDEVKRRFEALEIALWDAITMELKLIKPPEVLKPETEFEPQIALPTLTESERVPPEQIPVLSAVPPEKEPTLARDMKLTHGLIVDLNSGPRFSNQPVAELMCPESEVFSAHNAVTTEEISSSSMLDAAFTRIGFPPLSHMSNLPLLDDFLVSNDGTQNWTTRRIIVSHLNFSASPGDFKPNPEFVSGIRDALGCQKDWQKFEALKYIFGSWGVIIPLSAVIGSSSVATGVDSKPNWPRPPSSEELESESPDNWRIVKVTRVASILELLEGNLQARVKQLYAGLIFRSPCVGTRQLFGFDGGVNRGQRIEEIEIGFSDLRIESINIRYNGGIVAGPYGVPEKPTQVAQITITKDDGITDILVWTADDRISSIQFLQSRGRASPIYGMTEGVAHAPQILSGNGCILAGMSGGFDTLGITQIQAIWRGDTYMRGYRRKQVSHVGEQDGVIWSDLMSLGNPSNSRITSITATAPGTRLLGGLQTTYQSFVDGSFNSRTTLIHGTDGGPTVTWSPNGEHITRVRGRHNGKSLCELQFITHQLNSSPAFGQPAGDLTFDIEAPKTSEGDDMVLHYMTGTSGGCVNSISFVWGEQAEGTTLTMIPSFPPNDKVNPKATVYNLCTKTHNLLDKIISFEEYSKAATITRPTRVKSSLHALIIGINNYKSHNHLVAAVPDALNFHQYLIDDLLVPETQIRLLLNEQATRDNIIQAFQDLTQEDNGIKRNEAIVIYYAGHGGEIESSPGQALDGSLLRCIIPQDVSLTDGIFPITHFTIGALIHRISKEKGNNITLIFDCSYSASDCREESLSSARFVNKQDLPPLSELPDYAAVEDALSGGAGDTSSESFSQGVDTHILLAACGHRQAAFENREAGYGYFSRALLDALRSVEVDSLTYEGLMRRLPPLKTTQPQNPVCEGKHIDRILFDARVKGANTSFIPIEPQKDGSYLQAGLIKGIMPGSTFAIHEGDIFGPQDMIIGTFEVDEVDPFRAHVKDSPDLCTPCYARQVGYGPDHALNIFVEEAFVKAAEPSDDWSRAFSGNGRTFVLRPAEAELADVVLSINKENGTTFSLTNQVLVKHGIQPLPPCGMPPIPSNAPDVIPLLSILTKWNWYLRQVPTIRALQRFVDVEFYKLQSNGTLTDEGAPVFDTEGKDMVVGGEVNITSNVEDLYGLRVVNRSTVDLYVYLFAFSPTKLTIKRISIPPIGSPSDDAWLPKTQSLTIGYGPGVQIPFVFSLDDTQDADVTILRLFVSTHPTSFEGVQQDSPFERCEMLPDGQVRNMFGPEAIWDVIDINVVNKRWMEKDEAIIQPYGGGLVMVAAPGPGFVPVPDAGIMPIREDGIAPIRESGIIPIPSPIHVSGPSTIPVPSIGARPTPLPSVLSQPTTGDETSTPSSSGALFTGRSSSPLRVQARTSASTSKFWFRTPPLTQELLTSIRCMRLRTLANEKGPDGSIPSAETGGYFEISVIAPDGLPKLSATNAEMIYRSHSASELTKWADGIVFEEGHEIWKNLEVGDCFEVSVCAKGRGWVCEAQMGNLMFW